MAAEKRKEKCGAKHSSNGQRFLHGFSRIQGYGEGEDLKLQT
jgi:hypothetical protein